MTQLLNKRKIITEIEAKYYLIQIVNGLKYLHNNKIIHRDLKLDNLLITENMEIQIYGFHLSTKLKNDNEKLKMRTGSQNYFAPEIFHEKNGYSYERDIWSLGVILYELIIGKKPFLSKKGDKGELFDKIKRVDYSFPKNSNISESAKDLIKKIFVLDPKKRITLDGILNHDFLKFKENIPKILPSYTLQRAPSSEFIKKYDLHKKSELSPFNNNYMINDSSKEIKVKKTKEDLEKEIIILNRELSKEKNINQKLSNKIKELEKQLKDEKDKNLKKEKEIEELNNKIQELNALLNYNTNKDKMIDLMNKIISKDEEIKQLKSSFPFELSKEEKLMTVIFHSIDQKILYSVICKNTDKFTTIENLLYEEYPTYRDQENIFMINGLVINKYKNLEENHISNSAVILLSQL